MVISKSTEIGHWSYIFIKCYNLHTLEKPKFQPLQFTELEYPGEREKFGERWGFQFGLESAKWLGLLHRDVLLERNKKIIKHTLARVESNNLF